MSINVIGRRLSMARLFATLGLVVATVLVFSPSAVSAGEDPECSDCECVQTFDYCITCPSTPESFCTYSSCFGNQCRFTGYLEECPANEPLWVDECDGGGGLPN